MQQMLDLLQQQVTTMSKLQEENQKLKDAATSESPQRQSGEGGVKYKSKRQDRPVVDRDIDDREWAHFEDKWGRYKKMCGLKDTDVESIRLELRAACSSEVDKLLFEYVGSAALDECSEMDLLGHIKSVAVKIVHKEVHRMAFHKMLQQQGEPVTQWTARLKAKAFLCVFEVPCKCCTPAVMTSYAEDEIAQRLVAGLINQDQKRKVLAATLTTLDLKVKHLQTLETTEESVLSLHTPASPTDVAATVSQYKASKSKVTTPEPTCRWCGKTSHRGGGLSDRKKCPANNKKCNRCQGKGHFGVVCEKSEAAVGAGNEEGEEEVLPISSDSSVSFTFGATSNVQDFRLARGSNGNP